MDIVKNSKNDQSCHIIKWCKNKPTSWRKDKEHYWMWKKKTPKICNQSDFVTKPSRSCGVLEDFIPLTLVILHKVLCKAALF